MALYWPTARADMGLVIPCVYVRHSRKTFFCEFRDSIQIYLFDDILGMLMFSWNPNLGSDRQ